MSEYHISDNGLKLIERFEGYRDIAYQDTTGVWTIGYGTTLGAGVVDPLPETCTEAEAEQWLAEYVNKDVIPAITAALDAGRRSWNQNQIDAACSLGYNVGARVFTNAYVMGRDIRDHEKSHYEIGLDFLLYEYASGERLAGLVTRREVERALFDRPVKS